MKTILTGIKPTGEAHIGNYLGAIKPALAMTGDYNKRYFIADYHALNSLKNKDELIYNSLSIASCWLASGLDPQKVLFYRQSDVKETFELSTILMAFTAKGLMNRSHAYKASVDVNEKAGENSDHHINMGLFTYPVLMAADILLFDTNLVPVGRDQKQHIEMAVDIAQSVNFHYKKDIFTIPEPVFSEDSEVVVGLDGRKMSKSYDNTIPLFLETKQLKKKINSIITSSLGVDDVKDPTNCSVYLLYKAFASKEEVLALASKYRAGGMGFGEAKNILFEKLESYFEPMRDKYNYYMANPKVVREILADGGKQASSIAKEKIALIRTELGIDY